jgi:geranylgeranyl diphosphate synthase type II
MEKQTEKFAELWQYADKYRARIEAALREHLPFAPPHIETQFNDAVRYALFSGGKRLRPVLTLLSAELFAERAEIVLPAACAVEFIHTSSLIFDDLPCMDDASERRGKTSVHEKFGEGLAILVAIGFLNAAYGLVFVNHADSPERAMQAHAEMVECVGASGMIGGQSIDLALARGADAGAGAAHDYNSESIKNLKTSALMRLAMRVGAILAGANYLELAQLSRFAELLGDAYQLSDDILDSEEDARVFASKNFAAHHPGENAQLKLQSIITDAKRLLIENFPSSGARTCLIQLTDYLAERKD